MVDLLCNYCGNKYASQSALNRHIREKHVVDEYYDGMNVHLYKCLEGCEISFRFNFELRMHLETVHEMNTEEQMLNFGNIEEFTAWLSDLEDKCGYKYLKKRDVKNFKTKSRTVYFDCHRTGKSKTSESTRRSLKAQRSCKIDKGCTSQIKLKQQENGKYVAIYAKTHYGHSIDVRHLPLSKSERTNIARSVAIEIPACRIIEQNRDCNGKLNRSHLLKRKDVNNRKTSCRYQTEEGIRHTSKAVNNDVCVSEYEAEEVEEHHLCNLSPISSPTENPFSSNEDMQSEAEEIEEYLYSPSSINRQNGNPVSSNERMGLIEKISLQITKLKERVEHVENVEILSHVLQTITSVNSFIEASKKKSCQKEIDFVHVEESAKNSIVSSHETFNHSRFDHDYC